MLGFLGEYSVALAASPIAGNPQLAYSIQHLVVAWLSLAVTYPVTVLVFYSIGKRQTPDLKAGKSILTIFGAALLGEILGQTVFNFLPLSSAPFGFPYFYVTAPSSSLGFVFIAFSGFALSNLQSGVIDSGHRGRWMLVTLASLAFGVIGSFLLGAFTILANSAFNIELLISLSLLIFVFSLPLRFAVFYFIGRRVPVNGHTRAYFGLLFVGAYVGSVVGAVVSVALFGQAYWTLPPGQGSSFMVDGVLFLNTPDSLLVLLEALDPIASLPFLSFFAMSMSRTGNVSPSAQDVGLLESHPSMQSSEAA